MLSRGTAVTLAEISVVPKPNEHELNQRQLTDYRSEREDRLRWLLSFGKNPEKAEGHTVGTARN